jgi:hypothetical protein
MLLSPKYTAWRRAARLVFQAFVIGAFLLAAHPQISELRGDGLPRRQSRFVSLHDFLGSAVVTRGGKNSDGHSRGNILVFRLFTDSQIHLVFLLSIREYDQPSQPTVSRSPSIRSPPAVFLKSSP